MNRGDVWLVTLDPTVGSEIRKTRPCVIVSPDEMNSGLRTVVVTPMTTAGRSAPFRLATDFIGKRGLILTDQIRVVNRSRCVKRLGRLDKPVLERLLRLMTQMFDTTR